VYFTTTPTSLILQFIATKMTDMKRVSTRKRKSPDFLGNAHDDENEQNGEQNGNNNPVESPEKTSPEEKVEFDETLIPKRNAKGELVFKDAPKFRPNLTPEEVLRLGWHTHNTHHHVVFK
jgi:hypothetical protein